MIILKDFIRLTQDEIKLVFNESIVKFMKTKNISIKVS